MIFDNINGLIEYAPVKLKDVFIFNINGQILYYQLVSMGWDSMTLNNVTKEKIGIKNRLKNIFCQNKIKYHNKYIFELLNINIYEIYLKSIEYRLPDIKNYLYFKDKDYNAATKLVFNIYRTIENKPIFKFKENQTIKDAIKFFKEQKAWKMIKEIQEEKN